MTGLRSSVQGYTPKLCKPETPDNNCEIISTVIISFFHNMNTANDNGSNNTDTKHHTYFFPPQAFQIREVGVEEFRV